MESRSSNRFKKSFRKIHPHIQDKAVEKISLFEKNPFDPSLDTHKLGGRDKAVWAFSVTRSYRIKFIFIDEKSALLLEIGTHDIYK